MYFSLQYCGKIYNIPRYNIITTFKIGTVHTLLKKHRNCVCIFHLSFWVFLQYFTLNSLLYKFKIPDKITTIFCADVYCTMCSRLLIALLFLFYQYLTTDKMGDHLRIWLFTRITTVQEFDGSSWNIPDYRYIMPYRYKLISTVHSWLVHGLDHINLNTCECMYTISYISTVHSWQLHSEARQLFIKCFTVCIMLYATGPNSTVASLVK